MTSASEGLAMIMVKWRSVLLLVGTLLVALIGSSAAFADERPTIDCTIRFQLSGWSAIYERADDSGMVACADGTSLPVVIHLRGAGLTVGKSKVSDGTGTFALVHGISDVIGTYAQADVHAGIVKSGAAQVLTNGKVSLGIAGKGEGYDLGIGIAALMIGHQ